MDADQKREHWSKVLHSTGELRQRSTCLLVSLGHPNLCMVSVVLCSCGNAATSMSGDVQRCDLLLLNMCDAHPWISNIFCLDTTCNVGHIQAAIVFGLLQVQQLLLPVLPSLPLPPLHQHTTSRTFIAQASNCLFYFWTDINQAMVCCNRIRLFVLPLYQHTACNEMCSLWKHQLVCFTSADLHTKHKLIAKAPECLLQWGWGVLWLSANKTSME